MQPTARPWVVEPLIEALRTIDTSEEHVQANARHIVHCVNVHDKLIALAERLIEIDRTLSGTEALLEFQRASHMARQLLNSEGDT